MSVGDEECVVIDDCDTDTDDQPGPSRILHQPKACGYEVKWFHEKFVWPDQVQDHEIPQKDVQHFQNMIWNSPYDRMVPGYGMLPKELASVSSDGRKGWLVTSHFDWLVQCLNKQQRYARCFVLDPSIRKESIMKILGPKRDAERLIFVLSVGRHANGEVFLGTDKHQGDHWALAVVNSLTGDVDYCDTLGWTTPHNFVKSIINYTSLVGLSQPSKINVKLAHEPNTEQHECTQSCTNYPLQTCSDICGVIAMVCIAIAALDNNLFQLLMKPLNKHLNLYLSDPTEYSSYLRHVIIYWISRNHVDISKIKLKKSFDPYKVKRLLNGEKCDIDCGIKRRNLDSLEGFEPSTSKHMLVSPLTSHKTENGQTMDELSQIICDADNSKLTSELLLKEVSHQLSNLHSKKSEEMIHYSKLILNNSVERDKKDDLSTKSFILDITSRPGHPFVMAKLKGKEMKLDKEDIAFGIQTSFQKQLMITYGKKCLCFDITHPSEKCAFHVLTLSVFVEGKYECPVAWLVSNRHDLFVHNLFFEALSLNFKEETQPFQTECFIGDMNGALFKAWIQHFPRPPKRMFCSWDVLKSLKNHLDTVHLKPSDLKSLKDYLDVLVAIPVKSAFKIYLKAFQEMSKSVAPAFHIYFKEKFYDEGKDRYWASCYRHNVSFAHVPFLKKFFVTMERIEFFAKGRIDRTDILIHKLLQVSKFLERKIQTEISSVYTDTARQNIARKHSAPVGDLDIYRSTDGEEWYIRASSHTESCFILDSENVTCACGLRCEKCNICIHRYVCSCIDYLLIPGGCQHIHYVHSCRKMNSAYNSSMDTEEEVGFIRGKQKS